MPLYAYRCTQCGHRYEKIQSFSSKLDTVCPECGGKVERPLTAPGLSFKGAGWYVNDYASKSSASSSSDDNAASEKTAPTQAESSNAKPAAAESNSSATDSSTKPASTTSST